MNICPGMLLQNPPKANIFATDRQCPSARGSGSRVDNKKTYKELTESSQRHLNAPIPLLTKDMKHVLTKGKRLKRPTRGQVMVKEYKKLLTNNEGLTEVTG